MQDLFTILNALHRPRLLMRAARIGAKDYHRAAQLPRLLGYGVLPRHGAALVQLIELEAVQEELRKNGDASYNVVQHLDLLIAMVAEACALRDAQASVGIT